MKALILMSGGIDSTTCIGVAIEKYGKDEVIGLAISYGQKHLKELQSARNVASFYGIELVELDLAKIFAFSDCSLLSHSDKEIPSTSYDEQLKDLDGTPVSTYVPFRNGLFLSSSASIGLSRGCEVIYYGAHSDDSAGNAYPDCSQEFNDYMNNAIKVGSDNQIRLEAPFVSLTKADVVKKGLELNVPYHLTWSCYEGSNKPCGTCGTCIDRKKAFTENGTTDPLEQE